LGRGAGFCSNTAQDRQSVPSRNRFAGRNESRREKIALGRRLFFDKRLSADGTVSCATCHDPAAAFSSRDAVAIGINNRIGTRNVPTVLNAGYGKNYFWDGRALSLEEQARQPLLSPSEMGMNSESAVLERISSIAEYRSMFRKLFPRQGITLETITKAIAAYERTLLSNNAPFDRFFAGVDTAISENQKKGWALFKGKAGCIECHTYSTQLFTDFKFHNTGVGVKNHFDDLVERTLEITNGSSNVRQDPGLLAHQSAFSELGRFLVTGKRKDISAFKTPTLRDIELTGPYMHDGSLKTLLDVMRFYNQGGFRNPMLDEKVKPLDLSEQEMSEIVEFLRALTSNDVLRLVQSSRPQTRDKVQLPTARRFRAKE